MILGKRFRGGIHPPGDKELSAGLAILELPPPDRVAILLSQHIGSICRPVVGKGDKVRTGQVVGEATGFISAPVHSSITGTVAGIEDRPSPVTGARIPSVIIDRDGDDVWADGTNIEEDPFRLTGQQIIDRVLTAGIVGMGGAAFPTHVKLSPPSDKPIDTAILNGAECEPQLNADNRLMVERAADIVEGFRIILQAVNCRRGIIAIEKNKPMAIEEMTRAIAGDPRLTVQPLGCKYPQGGEHMLIKALLSREVPWRGGLPMAAGALVQNVATAFAVREAVRFRRPLIKRVVTFSGHGLDQPGNFMVRIGTPVRAILERCGIRAAARKLVFGGVMMGIAQRSDGAAIAKGTSGVLVLTQEGPAAFGPCIRCGRCLRCPYGLTPAMFSRAVEAGDYDTAQRWHVTECRECGCCAYLCPAKRPIVQQAKLAKDELALRRAREKERAGA